MKSVSAKILLIISLGAIFSVISEVWFYPVSFNVDFFSVLFAYGLIGYLFLIILDHYQIRSFAGMFIAAGIFGFLIEGIAVSVLYSSIPFSIVWTSLAWHALVTVTIGWYWFRLVLTTQSWKNIVLFNSLFGATLGIWGSYAWNSIESDTGEITGWLFISPYEYATQFIIGWILFIIAHGVFGYALKRQRTFSKFEKGSVIFLVTFFYLLLQFIPLFPLSLLLPALILLSVYAIRREKKTRRRAFNPLFI